MQTYSYCVRHRNGWGTGFGPRPTHCHECKQEFPIASAGVGGTGYGCAKEEPVDSHPDAPRLKPGESITRSAAICYACCHLHDIEELKDRSKPFTAYVSSDGRQITNWPGSSLGTIVHRNQIRLTRMSYTHGKYINHYRVKDVHGGLWYGRGNPGICITLRPMKGAQP